MRILITGGVRFIGLHSADAAPAAGHTVRVLDNLSTAKVPIWPSAELWVGDVADPGWARRAVEGCDALLHLAALVSVPQSLSSPQQTYAVNTTAL
jgi:UDP-glucose 4-epimerase